MRSRNHAKLKEKGGERERERQREREKGRQRFECIKKKKIRF